MIRTGEGGDYKKMMDGWMDGYVVVVFFDDDVSDHHAAGMIAVSPALHTTTTTQQLLAMRVDGYVWWRGQKERYH